MDLSIEKLRNLVAAGVAKRWGGADGKLLVLQMNIDYEIAAIERFGWVDYFVMAAEMVDAARKAGGRIGPGRGAEVASVVAYALGITNINPIGIPNLLFERFLNANTQPLRTLILIDMDKIGFDAAIAYLKERFGDVVRERKTHRLAPDCWTVGERSIGLTHLPQLDVISRTLSLIQETRGHAPDLDSMPYDSWNMLKLIRTGDISGVRGFDSPFAKKWLKRIAPLTFNELVAFHAMSRPWREKELSQYADVTHESDSAIWSHPLSQEVLAETRGIVVYQEQVVLLLRKFARFTRDEAEKCRKYISKMIPKRFDYAERFITGCMENPEFRVGTLVQGDMARAEAERIWDELLKMEVGCFASLKAHDVSCMYLAYQMAYLKSAYFSELMFAREECRTAAAARRMVGEITLDKIKDVIGEGMQVILLIRHAERPPLDPSDTTFGARLPIISKGKLDALRFGQALSAFVSHEDIAVFASETFRTIETAYGITAGIRPGPCCVEVPKVRVHKLLGCDTPFFGSLDERMELIAEGRYLDRLNEYYLSGEQKGYRPLAQATDEMERRLLDLNVGGKALLIAVTHDINVASFLAGRGVVSSFSDETWPHYLDAAVIMDDGYGAREYGWLRNATLKKVRVRTSEGVSEAGTSVEYARQPVDVNSQK